jgi:ketosteroid isomerase-like protein
VSQENVEIVRVALIASSGGDPAAAQAAYHPSAEWDMTGVAGLAEKDVYRGAEEVLPFLREWASSWADWHYQIEEVRDAGEQVFVAIHELATGADSGATVDQRRYLAVGLDHGLITRVRMFSERSDALQAAGLDVDER